MAARFVGLPLLGDGEAGPLLERLADLCLKKPTPQRKDLRPPRKKPSARILPDFHNRQKKHCFLEPYA